jgi:hypothetical protein
MPAGVKPEEQIESPVLDELVKWVKTLGTVGVSPDKAVEVARDFMLAACMGPDEEETEEWDDYDDEEEE